MPGLLAEPGFERAWASGPALPNRGFQQPNEWSCGIPNPVVPLKSCCILQRRTNHGSAVLDKELELVPVVAQETLHRPGGGFPECADRVAFDLTSGGLQGIEIAEFGLAFDDAGQHAVHPTGAFATRR